MIDADEFEYTLCDGFNMPPKECRAAFTMFSQVSTIHLVLLWQILHHTTHILDVYY